MGSPQHASVPASPQHVAPPLLYFVGAASPGNGRHRVFLRDCLVQTERQLRSSVCSSSAVSATLPRMTPTLPLATRRPHTRHLPPPTTANQSTTTTTTSTNTTTTTTQGLPGSTRSPYLSPRSPTLCMCPRMSQSSLSE